MRLRYLFPMQTSCMYVITTTPNVSLSLASFIALQLVTSVAYVHFCWYSNPDIKTKIREYTTQYDCCLLIIVLLNLIANCSHCLAFDIVNLSLHCLLAVLIA